MSAVLLQSLDERRLELAGRSLVPEQPRCPFRKRLDVSDGIRGQSGLGRGHQLVVGNLVELSRAAVAEHRPVDWVVAV